MAGRPIFVRDTCPDLRFMSENDHFSHSRSAIFQESGADKERGANSDGSRHGPRSNPDVTEIV